MSKELINKLSSPSETGRLVIVGGGPAGLAAAAKARAEGAKDIVIIERDVRLGGILNQCVHSGFGLHMFGQELTGPEYASRLEKEAAGITALTSVTVLNVTPSLDVECVSDEGSFTVRADAVILACGCRERPRGAIGIPGARCAGVYTAGTAQKLINISGIMPGRKFFILGSGDIGLIMARRAILQGGEVLGVAEIMPFSSGLKRNIAQCLDDYGVPLMLSHTVTDVREKGGRLCGVTVSRVDEKLSPVPGTERYFKCDTLLLSVGLLPEAELLRAAGAEIDPVTGGAVVDERMMTTAEGIFCVGNMLHVHDLVDYVSDEAARAGRSAAMYLAGDEAKNNGVGSSKVIRKDGGVRYVVPQTVTDFTGVPLLFRVSSPCSGRTVAITANGTVVWKRKTAFLTPSEMQRIDIDDATAAALNEADDVCITLL